MPVDAYRPFPDARTYIWQMDTESNPPYMNYTPGWDLATIVPLRKYASQTIYNPLLVNGLMGQAFRHYTPSGLPMGHLENYSPGGVAMIPLYPQFSVDFWIIFEPAIYQYGFLPTSNNIIHYGNIGWSGLWGTGFRISLDHLLNGESQIRFTIASVPTTMYGIAFSSFLGPIPAGLRWRHIACVCEGSPNTTMKIFIDGILSGSLTTGLPFSYDPTNPAVSSLLKIGGSGFANDTMDWSIDTTRIISNYAMPESFWRETVYNGPMLTRT